MSVIDEHNEQVYADVRAILSEHFPNFLFCVMDDDGDVYYDYTNLPIGKMLIREMQDDMESGAFEENVVINWDSDDDEEY